MTAQVNEERAQICVWFASTNLVASLTSNWQQLHCRECPEWVKIPGKWDKGREKRLKCLLLLHSPPLTHLGDRESWKCICSVEFEEKRLWANVWGAKLGVLESLKHTFGWNTTLCKEQVAGKTHKNVTSNKLVTRLKVRPNLAGTILLRFTEFWLRENMAISQMAVDMNQGQMPTMAQMIWIFLLTAGCLKQPYRELIFMQSVLLNISLRHNRFCTKHKSNPFYSKSPLNTKLVFLRENGENCTTVRISS